MSKAMKDVLSPQRLGLLSNLLVRVLSTSRISLARFRIAPLKEIGRLTKQTVDSDEPYLPGQMFIHKLFAYRGIIICSFSCRINEKVKAIKRGEMSSAIEIGTFYQVLIHRGDWKTMRFPVDITSYLGESGMRGERLLTSVNGMDCVPHEEVLPYVSCIAKPLDHDLFERIFEPAAEVSEEKGLENVRTDSIAPVYESEYEFGIRKELMPNYLANQRSWLAPQEVYRETTDTVKVTVTTFYLGANIIDGQQKHCWRYVIRLENTGKLAVTLRERSMKIFSLNNMQQVTSHDVIGTNPRLSPEEPAFQFSSVIDLPQPKGAHMWGKFKMERENGAYFDVTIPTITLESHSDQMTEQSGKQLR